MFAAKSGPLRALRTLLVAPYRQIWQGGHPAVARFHQARCTHLAGMIAYFALLSVIPGTFLLLSALALSGNLSSQGYLVRELHFVLPGSSVDDIVAFATYFREHSGSLGIVGLVGSVWGVIGFFSVLESAFNIIYELPNRPFLRQKLLVMVLVALALCLMVLSIFSASIVVPLLSHALTHSGPISDSLFDATLSLVVSMVGAFVFLVAVYKYLPNTKASFWQVWRGALVATLLFGIIIQILPVYLAISETYYLLKAFAGTLLLLVWFYLMALVILVGAVMNWYWSYRHVGPLEPVTPA